MAVIYGMWLTTAFAGMQFLFSPVLGEISDRFGRRPILLLALLGLSIDYLIHAWAPTITFLFIGRADISTPEEKAKNFGLIGAAFGLGFIIGPGIGGFFGEIDIRLPFYIAAGLTFANFVFGYFLVPESLTPENRRPINVFGEFSRTSIAIDMVLLWYRTVRLESERNRNFTYGYWFIGGYCARLSGRHCGKKDREEKNGNRRISAMDHRNVFVFTGFRTMDAIRILDSVCFWRRSRANCSGCNLKSSI